MPITITAEWQQIALYAVGAALVLLLLQKIPYVGRVVRFAVSLALLAFLIFLLLRHAPYEPTLARIVERIGLDSQEVVGGEVRIAMAPDGHFWANATLNGVERRMLIDSGATVTAISEATAAAASIEPDAGIVPVVLRTANGLVQARTGTIEELGVGGITARNLAVVISPAMGGVDVLGMNFLSELASWRVEGQTLILTPKDAEAAPPSD